VKRGAHAGRWLELAAVGLIAALYFHGAIDTTIDWTDEGQIVYPSWRTAEGLLPYVGFGHLYGPSVFFVNAALLRAFGVDLQTIRLSLVVLKALVSVLVYAVARRLAPRPIAAVTTGILIAAWGLPIWLFNTPYASYYGTALCLTGLLVFSGGPGRRGPRAFLAGLSFGLGATFKQTQGVFAALSLALFLLADTPAVARARPHAAGWMVGLLRMAILVGTLGFAVVYVRDRLGTPTVAALLAPWGLAVGALASREIAQRPWGEEAVAGLRLLALAALGTSLPIAGYALFYWWHGALAALVRDTVAGLPQRIVWFAPLPWPAPRPLLLLGVFATGFLALGAWQRAKGAREPRRALLAVGLALTSTGLLATFGALGGFGRFLRAGGLQGDVLVALLWLPFVLVGTGSALALWTPSSDLRLFLFFAVGALLQLYPAADLPHAMMMLPAFLPLLAGALGRLGAPSGERPASAGAVRAVGAAVGLTALATIGPLVQYRLKANPAPAPAVFARATGVAATDPRSGDVAALVRWLTAPGQRDRRLLVITNEQMIYFLAGTPSVLERDEFVLYLL